MAAQLFLPSALPVYRSGHFLFGGAQHFGDLCQSPPPLPHFQSLPGLLVRKFHSPLLLSQFS